MLTLPQRHWSASLFLHAPRRLLGSAEERKRSACVEKVTQRALANAFFAYAFRGGQAILWSLPTALAMAPASNQPVSPLSPSLPILQDWGGRQIAGFHTRGVAGGVCVAGGMSADTAERKASSTTLEWLRDLLPSSGRHRGSITVMRMPSPLVTPTLSSLARSAN